MSAILLDRSTRVSTSSMHQFYSVSMRQRFCVARCNPSSSCRIMPGSSTTRLGAKIASTLCRKLSGHNPVLTAYSCVVVSNATICCHAAYVRYAELSRPTHIYSCAAFSSQHSHCSVIYDRVEMLRRWHRSTRRLQSYCCSCVG